MPLKVKIQEDLKTALIGKKELELSVLRMLLAAVNNKETEKKTKIWKEKPEMSPEKIQKEADLRDEEIFDVISSEIKKRREAIEGFEKGGRKESADKERQELTILQKYLPEQMSEVKIKKLVAEAIKKSGAKEIKDMGKVMGIITAQIKGKADMAQVSRIVK
ncbi:MAG: GatB/YqeY domain-containing protein, partial [Patescibacteria group bacterium]